MSPLCRSGRSGNYLASFCNCEGRCSFPCCTLLICSSRSWIDIFCKQFGFAGIDTVSRSCKLSSAVIRSRSWGSIYRSNGSCWSKAERRCRCCDCRSPKWWTVVSCTSSMLLLMMITSCSSSVRGKGSSRLSIFNKIVSTWARATVMGTWTWCAAGTSTHGKRWCRCFCKRGAFKIVRTRTWTWWSCSFGCFSNTQRKWRSACFGIIGSVIGTRTSLPCFIPLGS